MKVILTGATGSIGSEVLNQLLNHTAITSIIALSRRSLPTTNPKLKTLLVEDFTTYSPSVLKECVGADACIWAMGLATLDPEKNKKINMEYTMAGAKALVQLLESEPDRTKKFNFVYLSGMIAERDQKKKLWILGDGRKVRGEVENQLIRLGQEHQDVLCTFTARPGAVLKKDTSFMMRTVLSAGGAAPTVRVDDLAAALIDVALNGSEKQIWENADLLKKGQEVLSRRA